MAKVQGWPPRYLSPIAPTELKRSRGTETVEFAEALCKITKDSIAGHAGEPLVFRGWQKELTKHLFAVDNKNSLKYRRALIGLPRKQGKSAWLSAIVLEHLLLGPNGGESYSCAADRDQAKIVFEGCQDMARALIADSESAATIAHIVRPLIDHSPLVVDFIKP